MSDYYSTDTLPMTAILYTPGVSEVISLRDASNNGYVWKIKLDNGRGLSVAHHVYASCTTKTFEVAVMDKDGDLDYSTPITGDVLTHVTPSELLIYVRWAASLGEITRRDDDR